MQALEEMHALHAPKAFSACTLWDGMLPHATLWTGPSPRQRYGATLLARPIDAEGYVATQQHRGMAHSEGWPFPAWQQSGGKGFHFSTLGDVWALQIFKLQPLASADGWEIDGATVGSRASPPDLPPWSKALGARLVTDASSPAAAAAPLELEVRRLTHHQSLWFKVEMDRFRLIERQWDSVLAEGDELWISAGRARYHCGLVSGARPVRADRTPWPGGAGVAKFVEQGRQPAPVAGTPTIPATLGP